ncbi:unnamed protein product [Moneuplotes crassus]|uniref:Uncharacterized protein n=2 Tax=Euplotes crassus TaxID=5936 RepID=A0AAD2D4B0_EUPCR|nr:unnamed protein product [Moneuplotes crassus]
MNILDKIANNFRFHDKAMRATGYSMKALANTEKMKGSEIASIMNKFGSKVSWVRQTLRVGSEFGIYKGLLQIFKKKATTNQLEWWTQLIEYIVGVYFYVIDHLEWLTTNRIVVLSKVWNDWVGLESTRAWFYSTIAQTLHRLGGIYNAWKALKQADKMKMSKQDKEKILKTKRTLIYMLIKGFVDFAHIAHYLAPEIAARDSISYLFGVISSFMDIFLIFKGGSL